MPHLCVQVEDAPAALVFVAELRATVGALVTSSHAFSLCDGKRIPASPGLIATNNYIYLQALRGLSASDGRSV
jgi:hypothetical protein